MGHLRSRCIILIRASLRSRLVWQIMKLTAYSIVFGLAISTCIYPQPSPTETRDDALRAVEACLRRNEASSRECRGFNSHVQTLIDDYWQGDKTVLPVLLKSAWSTEFYEDALIANPEGFLTAVSQMPEQGQRTVAGRIAGPPQGVTREQFDHVRATLMNVPSSSPNYQLARACLARLETENVSFLVAYFPPQTFAARSEMLARSFSHDMYVLKEKPIWSHGSLNDRIYRVTILPRRPFASQSIALTVMPDGSAQAEFRTADWQTHTVNLDSPRSVSRRDAADFIGAMNQIQFWEMPTELPPGRSIGLGGADWIVEAVEDGSCHIVYRWCPGNTPLGKVVRHLFDLSGHKLSGICGLAEHLPDKQ